MSLTAESPSLVLRSCGQTDVGRARTRNEDAFLTDDELQLYIVADGMGGHSAGEIASHETVDAVYCMVKREHETLRALRQKPQPTTDEVRRGLRLVESAVQSAAYHVYGMAQNDPGQRGMGTTVSALVVCGRLGLTAQVGDSRIYRVRGSQVTQLTEDHTLVAWQIKQGLITEEEAARSPQRNVITRAVGSKDYVHTDTAVVDVNAGDRFMLCSDGLYAYLRETELPDIVAQSPAAAARELISLANARGGHDNITAIVVQVDRIP